MAERFVLEVSEGIEDDDLEALRQGLTEHSLPFVGRPGFQPLSVLCRDPEGGLRGGIMALVNWNWLDVSLVWLRADLRRTGLGRRLMQRVEEEGRARGCAHAHLDTFSYQARPFYESLGYTLFATLEDYPSGHRRFFLRKTL